MEKRYGVSQSMPDNEREEEARHFCEHEHVHHADCEGYGHEHECHDPHCTDPEHHHHHHEENTIVQITHHEGSVIGSMKGTMPVGEYDEAERKLALQMREAGRRITQAGGVIGHIKFILTSSSRCGRISLTGTNENIRHFENNKTHVEGVAIVFAIRDELLSDILTNTVGSLMRSI